MKNLISGMQNLYAIGNSHANFFTLSSPQTKNFWTREALVSEDHNFQVRSLCIGPILAYTCPSKHFPLIMHALEVAPDIKKGDFVLLAVGEVDCRLHIPKNCEKKGMKITEGVDLVCQRLIKMLKLLKTIGYEPIAWGGHPSTTDDYSDNPVFSKDYPNYGNPAERNKVSDCYNKRLMQLCNENQILFCSIFNELVDERLSPKPGILQDPCHLTNSVRTWSLMMSKIRQCIDSRKISKA